MDWHTISNSKALTSLHSDVNTGLSEETARKLRNEGQINSLTEKKKKNIIVKFFSQFTDFMIIILLIAAGMSILISFLKGKIDLIDPIMILAIVLVNATIQVVQENRAENAISALKKLSSPRVAVLRNGKTFRINSEELVCGDILFLETGDFVPADCKILSSSNLKVEESSLTGESLPVEKSEKAVVPSNAPIGDRKNMLFSSSAILNGRCTALVVEIGMNTEVGKIAGLINIEESPDTPLQKKLEHTGKILGTGAVIICAVIFLMGTLQKVPPFEMFMISISLAVAAIPEGLAAIVTIILAIGVQRMAKCNAIIRRLPAVETLGSATVICSDKTGTLTQNKITVVEIQDESGVKAFSSAAAKNILTFSALCSNAEIKNTRGNFTVNGDPTETSLVIAASKQQLYKSELEKEFPRIFEIPFNSSRKLMTTIHKSKNGRYLVITKGAPDVLINRCGSFKSGGNAAPLVSSKKSLILEQNNKMASKALRVIGIAFKELDSVPENVTESFAENELTFLGLVGMIDPPRPEAKNAVKDCMDAGIKPVMITGDHIETARAIAFELGIMRPGDQAVTGQELDKMGNDELKRRIYDYAVFARVSPEHKAKIVKAYQAHGEVVAMTGDGVNDAPALKTADIGCAMGISGTEVAKADADMVLTDDNFATIVEAVRQGRGIYDNIKKTIHFLLSSNIGEIVTIFVGFLLKIPAPLLAIQLLWVNLITDSFPALALGVEKIDRNVMKRKPVNTNKSILAGELGLQIIFEGLIIGSLAILAFTIGRVFFDVFGTVFYARTLTFAVLSISQLVHAFNVRSEESVLKTGLFSNKYLLAAFILSLVMQVFVINFPPLSSILKTVPLNLWQWGIVLLLSIVPLIVVELQKLFGSSEDKNVVLKSKLKRNT